MRPGYIYDIIHSERLRSFVSELVTLQNPERDDKVLDLQVRPACRSLGHKVIRKMGTSQEFGALYSTIQVNTILYECSVTVNIDGEEVRYFHAVKEGVDRVFVDHPWFLAKVCSW